MSRPMPNTVVIQLMGNDYQIACPAEEEKALRASAEYLDKQMRRIREKGKIIGLERIAVMAALNLAHELLQAQTGMEQDSGADEAIKRLNSKLDKSLNQLKQLTI